MSPAQNSLYWREWAAAKRVLKLQPSWTEFVEAVHRHALHRQALGQDRSHTDFTNKEFDKVLGVFRGISRPADMAAQIRQLEQERIRIRGRIGELQTRLGVGPEYVDAIAQRMWMEGKIQSTDIELLKPEHLLKLVIALTIAAKRKEARGPGKGAFEEIKAKRQNRRRAVAATSTEGENPF